MLRLIKSISEKCHYCDKDALYWDQNGATIISVCKEHMINYYVG